MTYPQNKLVIDLSHYQPNPDFGAVKGSGVLGCIHKYSEGTTMKDATYIDRRVAAKSAGLLWGRYQFGHPGNIEAQVANFLDGWQPDELLALDWEGTPATAMSIDDVIEFQARVLAITGQKITIYSGNAAKEAMGVTPVPALNSCRLWLAQYGSTPVCPPGWSKPWLWQWTSHGSVPGITSNVDLDSFDGTEDELKASWTGGAAHVDPPAVLVETPVMDTVTVTISVPRGSTVSIKTTGNVETS